MTETPETAKARRQKDPKHPVNRYPDSVIIEALDRAVQKCNKRVSPTDVIVEIIGIPFWNPLYKRKVPIGDQRYLTFRISTLMRERNYKKETKSVWIVKWECVV